MTGENLFNRKQTRTINLLDRSIHASGQMGDGKRLRALGLWPPWGTAIARLLKDTETRSWYKNFTGPLAIYQTKGVPADALEDYRGLQLMTGKVEPFGLKAPKTHPLGAVVAICRVVTGIAVPTAEGSQVKCLFYQGDGTEVERIIPPTDGSPDRLLGNYSATEEEPRFGWILADVMPLTEPIPVPNDGMNRQGIFDLPDETAAACLREYRAYLIGLRPKCKFCGSPVGYDGWEANARIGWIHRCKPKQNALPGGQVVEYPERLRHFIPGRLPDVPVFAQSDSAPTVGAESERGRKSKTAPLNLSLFD